MVSSNYVHTVILFKVYIPNIKNVLTNLLDA